MVDWLYRNRGPVNVILDDHKHKEVDDHKDKEVDDHKHKEVDDDKDKEVIRKHKVDDHNIEGSG